MQKRVALLEKTLAEMEETDRLRDRASAVLKEELAEMRRRETRGRVDLTYVKSVRRALRMQHPPAGRKSSPACIYARGVESDVSFSQNSSVSDIAYVPSTVMTGAGCVRVRLLTFGPA
jgi:hypothetical protein